MVDDGRIRHSEAESATIIEDELARAKREAANGVLQAERVRQLILDTLDGRPFKLRPSTILGLNRCAIEGLDSYAGSFRPGGVAIGESAHQPPGAHLVPELVDDLCDYINDSWSNSSSIHLAAMIMWRMNWIHPFTDGNGRTSRAVSYLVLCAHAGVGGVSKSCWFALCSCASVRYAEATEAPGDPPCPASTRPSSAACLPA